MFNYVLYGAKFGNNLHQDISQVPGIHIASAIIPAFMFACLFFFEHNVAAKMAQQRQYNLKNPPSYHYDFLLLGFMVPSINSLLLIIVV